MSEKIAIVGAGVGGLATAARLASRGYQVEIFEKLNRPGGRAHIIEDSGFKIDTGPSFVMMPGFFKEVFDYCKRDIKNYLNLKELAINYKIFYPDGDSLSIFNDISETEKELERIEPGSAVKYRRFLEETGKLYKTVEPLLYGCFKPGDLINPKLWPLVPKLKVGKTYWQLAKQFFKTDKLCYAFTFEAMFIGVSPFKTPAFYSVISYADHIQKISHSMGGMYQIPKALEKLAKEFGVKFNYSSEVESITEAGEGIILKSKGHSLKFSKVVVNADYSYACEKLLRKRIPKYQYSCSVYLLYWGLNRKIKGLEHHNLFFAKDLKSNLQDIFHSKVMPKDFSFYIHVPTVTDSSLAPEGKDIVYVLVPVPNLDNCKSELKAYEESVKRVVLDKIKEVSGEAIETSIEIEHKFYPQDFIDRYNINYGATFGLAHTLFQSAFFRPPNYHPKNKRVYFVGASTQPGGGLPPVIASSKIVADLIQK